MKSKTKPGLDRVDGWLDDERRSVHAFRARAADLLRAIREAESPEQWKAAVETGHRFLANLGNSLDGGRMFDPDESARVYNLLLSLLIEAGQYRHECYTGDPERTEHLQNYLLPAMVRLRGSAADVLESFLSQRVFASLAKSFESELFPLVEELAGRGSAGAPRRFMPFRVALVGGIYERLHRMRLRTDEPQLVGHPGAPGLLGRIYAGKYLRFGTSGVRGRWNDDFTEQNARRVVQAICDYLSASDLPVHLSAPDLRGKIVVIGYDSRRNADIVARWASEVCLANGFRVHLATRDTPTPALAYYLTDQLPADDVAGLLICTASHNPPEWQGLKFNPRQGYPAPTSITDFVAARANELYLAGRQAAWVSLVGGGEGERLGRFDVFSAYTDWLLCAGKDDGRIPIDTDRIREFVGDRRVLVDEMHGASRGYMGRLLGEIGVRHRVLEGDRDPNLGGLAYANPEEPFITPLAEAVASDSQAIVGLAMDTDADRFGVVDADGTYFRPNQVIPMLVRYLRGERGLEGRVVATQTGSPMLEVLAGQGNVSTEDRPMEGAIPAYVAHPFYDLKVGNPTQRVYENVFMVPVGIKYIEEQRRTDRRYGLVAELPERWRDKLLLGGEESSGLTTRGHVTDKDGIWANLLILDMMAHYGKGLGEIWSDTVEAVGVEFFGGIPGSNTGRQDLDAVLEVKEELINSFLARFEENPARIAGLKVVYAGGVWFDLAEMELEDDQGGPHYLRIRASGTEPIIRVYVESSDAKVAHTLQQFALGQLDEFSRVAIERAGSEWRMVDILAATEPTDGLIRAVREALQVREGWSASSLASKLRVLLPWEERRNQEVITGWLEALGGVI